MTLIPVFRKAARLEYDEAVIWYESNRAGLGIEFIAEIENALHEACETPMRFSTVIQDVRRIRVRRFPYFIFFRVRADQLIVLAVFHSRRQPSIWRERT